MKRVCATTLALFCLTAAASAHAQHPAHKTEAIATVQNSYGVTSTYSVGLSFGSSEECEKTLSRMYVMFQNLHLQGVSGVSGITLNCVKPKVIN